MMSRVSALQHSRMQARIQEIQRRNVPLAIEHLTVWIAAIKKASDLVEEGFSNLESGYRFGGAVTVARNIGRSAAFSSTRKLETALEQEIDNGSRNARSRTVTNAGMYCYRFLSGLNNSIIL